MQKLPLFLRSPRSLALSLLGIAIAIGCSSTPEVATQGDNSPIGQGGSGSGGRSSSGGSTVDVGNDAGMSNMGGISAQTGRRQGEVGAIVFGGVRDVGHSRACNYPIWSTELSAVTGKWRLQTIEINGPVQIGGVRVEPGDLVVADETSVCFIPRERMTDVLTMAHQKAEAEDIRCRAIDDGLPVPDISRATYGEKS